MYIHTITINKKWYELEREQEGYIENFGEKKRKKKCCNYILISKQKGKIIKILRN